MLQNPIKDNPFALLKLSAIEEPDFRNRLVAEWMGPRHLPLNLDTFIMKQLGGEIQGNRVVGLPWPLLILEECPPCMYPCVCCVRTDTFVLTRLWHTLRYKARGMRGFVCARVVWTLHIWGVGTFARYDEPSFSNLRWFWQKRTK